jgi:tRNA threonylcarbamoyladenosine dehydratase
MSPRPVGILSFFLVSTASPMPPSTAPPCRRFERMARLVGQEALNVLTSSHVMVVGLGGVGSFAAESLARSAVGRLTLIDHDRVCETNINRQLQATSATVGQPKAAVLAERLRLINPAAQVCAWEMTYQAERTAELFRQRPNFVVDAIDNLTHKCALITACREHNIRMVVSLGAAGRLDPSLVGVDDLGCTKHDPLGRMVRKLLRQRHGFPRRPHFGIPAVFSSEAPLWPVEPEGPDARPPEPQEEPDSNLKCWQTEPSSPPLDLTAESEEGTKPPRRHIVRGSACFVTGAFGLFCASVVVRGLLACGATPNGIT